MQFAESEHSRAMRLHETRLAEAKASNSDARAEFRKRIEDNLVKEGLQAIEAYEGELRNRRKKANCLAEFDGISMGFAIASRARERIAKA